MNYSYAYRDSSLPMHTDIYFQNILTARLHAVTYSDVCDRIQTLVKAKQSSYIIAANVHVIMTAYRQPDYHKVLKKASIVTPDGMPLVMGMRWLGGKKQSRVYGPDLMLAWCDRAQQVGQSIYLYGSTPQTLNLLSHKLKKAYPNLVIAGTHSPPFRPLTTQEEEGDIARIRASGASVVFVGLGCPKQEEWMYRQLGKLDAVMIGVGAAFKMHSGEISQAPRWMMKLGLEWLFRLVQDPKRLWLRYYTTNFPFILLFSQQLFKYHLRNFTHKNKIVDTLLGD